SACSAVKGALTPCGKCNLACSITRCAIRRDRPRRATAILTTGQASFNRASGRIWKASGERKSFTGHEKGLLEFSIPNTQFPISVRRLRFEQGSLGARHCLHVNAFIFVTN